MLMSKEIEKKQMKKKYISLITLFGRLTKNMSDKNEGVKQIEDI